MSDRTIIVPRTGFQWTGTVSAVASSSYTVASAANFGLAGAVQFTSSHFFMTSTGTCTVSVEREEGCSGAASFTVSTYDITGDCAMTASTNYTAVSEVVSYADNEGGVKSVSVVINSVPSVGLHLIGLEITGASTGLRIKTPRAYVHIDDGGVNPGATIVTTSTSPIGDIANAHTLYTTRDTTPAAGEIVVGNIADTFNAASAGDLIYVRGGTYYDNRRNSGQGAAGVNLTTSGTKAAPIILCGYPGETAVLDQQYSLNDDNEGWDETSGFHIRCSDIQIRNIHIKRCLFSGIIVTANGHNNVYFGLNIEDTNAGTTGDSVGLQRDNIGSIRPDSANYSIIAYCYLNGSYGSGQTSNPLDATPRGLSTGVHGYGDKGTWIHNCTGRRLSDLAFQKKSNAALDDGRNVHNNLVTEFTGAVLQCGVQGASDNAGNNISVFRNLAISDKDDYGSGTSTLVNIVFRDDVTSQPDGLFVYNNTLIDANSSIVVKTMTSIHQYSNVIHDCKDAVWIDDNINTYDNELAYCDYDNYSTMGTFDFLTGRSGSNKLYTDLAAFAAADMSLDPVVADSPAMAANSTESTPTFVNSGSNDYRTTNLLTSGYGGKPQGIGSELVGHQGRAVAT